MTRIEDALRDFDDIKEKPIEVPEWAEAIGNGGALTIRSMNGTTRAAMLREAIDAETGETDFEKLYPQIVIATAYDPTDATPAFTQAAAEWLNSKNAKALERVAMAGMEMSGLDAKASDKAGANFPEGGK